MSSLTTNPPPAKRRRTALQPATIEALEEERAEPIEIGKKLWEIVENIQETIYKYIHSMASMATNPPPAKRRRTTLQHL